MHIFIFSLFLQDEKGVENVVIWGVKGLGKRLEGLTAFAHTCCYLMKRISRRSHEPAWPEPTLVLMDIFTAASPQIIAVFFFCFVLFLNCPFKNTSNKNPIIDCMVH